MLTHMLWLYEMPNQNGYLESVIREFLTIHPEEWDYKMVLGWLWETAGVF